MPSERLGCNLAVDQGYALTSGVLAAFIAGGLLPTMFRRKERNPTSQINPTKARYAEGSTSSHVDTRILHVTIVKKKGYLAVVCNKKEDEKKKGMKRMRKKGSKSPV